MNCFENQLINIYNYFSLISYEKTLHGISFLMLIEI